jgi:ribosomal-protein-alanine N-acetyltransferase
MDSSFRLETERLLLRPFTTDDVDAIHEVLGDAEIMTYYPAPFTLEKSRQWVEWNLANYRAHGHGLWVLESKETGRLVGDCGLVPQVIDGVTEVEVGWHVHRDHQRRGLATEAARECCRYAFEEMGVTKLISLIRPENVPSRRVAEKLGMEVEKEISHGPGPGMPHLVYRATRPT